MALTRQRQLLSLNIALPWGAAGVGVLSRGALDETVP